MRFFAKRETATILAECSMPKDEATKLMRAAHAGDAEAQYKLGCQYYKGDGLEQDKSKAAEWFEKAAKQGHAEAQYSLAKQYYCGEGVGRNYYKAGELLKKAEGLEKAQNALLLMYCRKELNEGQVDLLKKSDWMDAAVQRIKDMKPKNGEEYYLRGMVCHYTGGRGGYDILRAARKYKNPKAMHELGCMHLYGNDEWSTSVWCGVRWFKRAAKYGDEKAQLELALMYKCGVLIEGNRDEAIKWLTKSAEQGNAEAKYELSYYIEDRAEGIQLREEAAKLGNSKAIRALYRWSHVDMEDYGRAAIVLKQAAEQGCDIGAGMLGMMYRDGLGVEKDYEKAIKYLQDSIDFGFYAKDAPIIIGKLYYELGVQYRDGIEVEKSYEKAIEMFEKSIERDNAKAEESLGELYYELGMKHRSGIELEKSNEKAIEMLEKSIELGNPKAKVSLGKLYYDLGLQYGAEKDRAIEMFEKAANYNNPDAKLEYCKLYLKGEGSNITINKEWLEESYIKILWLTGESEIQSRLGKMYYEGKIVEQDFHKAAMLFKASNGLNEEAQYRLALMYRDGIGLDRDYVKAAELLKKLAEGGNAAAQYDLAVLYRDGHGVKRDYKKAAELFEKLADEGNPDAQYNMIAFYRNVLKGDNNKMSAYIEMLAKQDNDVALYRLGLLYQKGLGVDQDNSKALKLFIRSVKLGNVKAKKNLGKLYYELGVKYRDGVEVNRDNEKATRLFKKASHFGNIEATRLLAEMFLSGQGVEWNEERAFRLFKKAADRGDAESSMKVGFMYYNGLGVKEDRGQAREYFMKARKMGHPKAKDALGLFA